MRELQDNVELLKRVNHDNQAMMAIMLKQIHSLSKQIEMVMDCVPQEKLANRLWEEAQSGN